MIVGTKKAPYPICIICHQASFTYLAFPELVLTPVICARCLFEKLTGTQFDWTPEVELYMSKEKK